MANKKLNYTATGSFQWQGQEYKKGDTFRKPDDWELDEAHMEMLSMNPKGNKDRTAFVYEAQVGWELPATDEQGVVQRQKPSMTSKRIILPVT